jgi:hypothetical protein
MRDRDRRRIGCGWDVFLELISWRPVAGRTAAARRITTPERTDGVDQLIVEYHALIDADIYGGGRGCSMSG